jgi:hypothetical protein
MKMKKPDAGRFGMLGSLAAFLDGLDGFVAFAFGTFANFSGFSFTSPFRFFPTLLCITKRRRSVLRSVLLPFLAIRNPSLVAKMRHILLGNLRKSSQQKKTMHTAITDVVKSHSSSLFLVSTTFAETFILAADTNMKTKET